MCECKSNKDSKLVNRLTVTVVAYLTLCAATIRLFLFKVKAEDSSCLFENLKENSQLICFFVTLVILSVVCFVLVLIFMRLYNDKREEELRER